MSTVAHGRRFRLPADLMARLEAVAAANARTVEAEMELVLAKHAADWEDRTKHLRGTTAIADHRNRTHEARRLQAEEAAREAAAELRRRRIEVVRSLATWTEIAAPEQPGRLVTDAETGQVWQLCRGIVFPTDQAHPLNEWSPHAFYVENGEIVVLEPLGGRPVPA